MKKCTHPRVSDNVKVKPSVEYALYFHTKRVLEITQPDNLGNCPLKTKKTLLIQNKEHTAQPLNINPRK